MIMKKKTIFKMRLARTENTFGIRVNKLCASCAYKDLTRAVSLRRCTKHGEDVRPRDVCKCWAMSEQLQLAGRTQGRVKRKEYLMYLVAVREDERLRVGDGTSGMASAEQMGKRVKAKSIAQVRAEFEREHGSIYIKI